MPILVGQGKQAARDLISAVHIYASVQCSPHSCHVSLTAPILQGLQPAGGAVTAPSTSIGLQHVLATCSASVNCGMPAAQVLHW